MREEPVGGGLAPRPCPWVLWGLALSLAPDPGLTPLARGLDDEPLCQTVRADVAPAVRGPRSTDARRPRSRSSCGCGWASPGMGGALRQPRSGSAIAWGGARAGASPQARAPHRRAGAAGPTCSTRRPCPPGSLPWSGWRGRSSSRLATSGDGTGVRPTSHRPSDRPGLYAGVRVLSRRWANATLGPQATPALARRVWRERPRRAKRLMQRSREAARQRGTEAADRRPTASQHRRAITRATGPQGQPVGPGLQAQAPQAGQPLAGPLEHVVPWGWPVVTPTTRRVLQGATVAASATWVSLCAPQTARIRPGQPGHPRRVGVSSGGMRWRAASSAVTPCWRAIRPRRPPGRYAWPLIGGCANAQPAGSLGLEVSLPWRLRRNGGAGEAPTGARASLEPGLWV
jgi:hypothetical protein